MATSKPRRRQRRSPAPEGKDRYYIYNEAGTLVGQATARPLALVSAQHQALISKEPQRFRIERETLFGPRVEIATVVRDEDDVVHTFAENVD